MQRRGGLCDQFVQPGGGAGPRPGAEVQHVAGTPGASAAAQRVGGTLPAGETHLSDICGRPEGSRKNVASL